MKFPNGAQFKFPADIVADDRAKYYAKQDKPNDPEGARIVYEQEFDYTMADPSELTDWLKNNMDWAHVSHAATEIESAPKPDYAHWFSNAETKVVDA